MNIILLELLVFAVASLVMAVLCYYIVRPLLGLGRISPSTRLWLYLAGSAYILSLLSFIVTAFQTGTGTKFISIASGAGVASYGLCCIARGINGSEAEKKQTTRTIFLIGVAGIIVGAAVVVYGMFPV